ncbi:Hypothetical protein CINCED_3A003283 [Cinara cedri]|uniref:Uncharacterized protein n=1 Tax=Cinara cedri TaxID=506608 RepID=A0A5E4MNZ1_9HEMI|nr:Hypothetical protein CINCED_3A003283 [Cinara cedri]
MSASGSYRWSRRSDSGKSRGCGMRVPHRNPQVSGDRNYKQYARYHMDVTDCTRIVQHDEE